MLYALWDMAPTLVKFSCAGHRARESKCRTIIPAEAVVG